LGPFIHSDSIAAFRPSSASMESIVSSTDAVVNEQIFAKFRVKLRSQLLIFLH
jgi:hypothetical protein